MTSSDLSRIARGSRVLGLSRTQLFVLFLLALLFSGVARPQDSVPQTPLPEINLAALTAEQITGQATAAALRILGQPELMKNTSLATAAVRLHLLSALLQQVTASQRNVGFNSLSDDVKDALSQLNTIIVGANRMLKRNDVSREKALIDLQDWSTAIPLLSTLPTSIFRIDGLYQIQQKSDYQVVVSGRGFGKSTLGETRTSAYVNGKAIPEHSISVTNDRVLMRMPSDLLSPNFGVNTVRVAWLYIRQTHSLFFGRSTDISFNIPILLLPRANATFSLTSIVNKAIWESAPSLPRSYDFTVGGFGFGATPFRPFSFTVPVPENFRVESVKVDGLDNACRWCYAPDGSGLSQNINKTWQKDDGSNILVLKCACNGDLCHLRWTVSFKQLSNRNVSVPIGDRRVVRYGETFSYELPEGSLDWLLYGELYTGEKIELSKGGRNPLLEHVSSANPAGGERLTFTFKNPLLW